MNWSYQWVDLSWVESDTNFAGVTGWLHEILRLHKDIFKDPSQAEFEKFWILLPARRGGPPEPGAPVPLLLALHIEEDKNADDEELCWLLALLEEVPTAQAPQ